MSSWFKNQLKETTETLKKGVSRVRNQTFLEALIAGFVMVAHADGTIKPEEKAKLMAFIRSSELLSVFDENNIRKYMDKYLQHYAFDPVIAESSVLDTIAKLKGKESEARLLVRICIAVAAADGVFDPDEKAMVVKICATLNLSPEDFDLNNVPTAASSSPSTSVPSILKTPTPQSPTIIQRGERVSLRQRDFDLQQVQVGLGWDSATSTNAALELDASAFLLGTSGKVRSETDFIFYNQRRSPEGAVEHQDTGPEDATRMRVDMPRVPVDVQRIVFTVTIHEADQRHQTFSQVRNAYIRLLNPATGAEILRYQLAGDAGKETALIFGELYRHGNEWRFTAVGQGYAGGLPALCERFGVTL